MDDVWQEPFYIVRRRVEAVEYLDEGKQDPHELAGGPAPVGDMQLPAGFQHPVNFPQGGSFLGLAQVMKEQARNDPVETALLERQPGREAAVEDDFRAMPARLPLGNGQDLGVSVDAYDLCPGFRRFHPYGKGAGAASHIEDPVPGPDAGLVQEQALEGFLPAGECDDGIVYRSQQAISQCRNIPFSRRLHLWSSLVREILTDA
jgi:hypothetical protein